MSCGMAGTEIPNGGCEIEDCFPSVDGPKYHVSINRAFTR